MIERVEFGLAEHARGCHLQDDRLHRHFRRRHRDPGVVLETGGRLDRRVAASAAACCGLASAAPSTAAIIALRTPRRQDMFQPPVRGRSRATPFTGRYYNG